MQIGSNLYQLVKTSANWLKLVQNGAKRYKLMQTIFRGVMVLGGGEKGGLEGFWGVHEFWGGPHENPRSPSSSKTEKFKFDVLGPFGGREGQRDDGWTPR